jgi:UDP-N-acetylmuramate dehydrogenase
MTLKSLPLQENIPLAPYTSFGVGGPARYFVEVKSREDALQALDFASAQRLSLFILGGGSNLLISDDGFPGIVILNRIRGFQVEREGNSVLVSAGGGEDWQEFADRCVNEEWQGVECLAGIPGTVGASPVQNIGAYGQEAGQTIVRVDALETATGNSITLEGCRCGFGYRTSIFNTTATGKYLITGVTFRLAPGGEPYIAYRELEERFGLNREPSLDEVRNAVLSIREGKGLLIREGFEQFKSAGSFFKNPIVARGEYEMIAKVVESCGASANWAWPLESGMVKLSAACLIQCAGFKRGYCRGEVGISPRHSLIMMNHGGASASDIVTFAMEVTQRVFERFGVVLSPEVRMVGFQGSPFENWASTIQL